MHRKRKSEDTSPKIPMKVWASGAPETMTAQQVRSDRPASEGTGRFKIKWDPSWTTGAASEKPVVEKPVVEKKERASRRSSVAVIDDVAPPPPRATKGKPIRIGELLVDRGLITSAQLDHALAEQSLSGRRLGSELIHLGMVTERQLIEALA